jgi:WD40 repeat protein/DNA-binding XRE family transcriptional regulator
MHYPPLLALRQERERRGWSRNYVAEMVEVDVITVGRWERGERMPHPHYRQKLCALFEMTAQNLGLLPMLSQESHDTTSSEVPGALIEPQQEQYDGGAAMIPDRSSGTLAALSATVSPPEEMSSTKAKTFHSRRTFLFAGLGGLGALTIAGSRIVWLTAHSSPANASADASTYILMPLSKRSHHFVDPNTDGWVNRMAWSPDNTNMAVANGASVITIWKPSIEGIVLYYPTLNLWVNDISWSKKTNMIAAATADYYAGSVQVWKFPDKKPLFTLKRPYGFYSASWSPDGKYLAISAHSPTVEVWNPFTSKLVGHYSDPTLGLLGIRRVLWSPSGRYLACGADDGTLHVWEALTNKRRTICHQHRGRVIDLAWSPDEQYIVSASADKTSKIWEASSGRCVLTYRGHTDQVETVDWSPHNTYIASGSADCTAHVWEPSTGKLIAKYAGRTSTVETVLWSVDGTTLAIGTQKEGVEIWQAPPAL